VQSVVDWYGPTDLLEMNRQAIEGSTIDHDAPESPEGQLIGAPIQTQPDAARRASPMTYVGDVKPPPFLIVHGERDRLVPAGQSVLLAEALEKAGADVELSLVPEADHVFVGDPDLPERIDELIAFLRKKLLGSSSGNRS
jgi:dipeptidyl aminopeptidase/acylaminoacyl peptidase